MTLENRGPTWKVQAQPDALTRRGAAADPLLRLGLRGSVGACSWSFVLSVSTPGVLLREHPGGRVNWMRNFGELISGKGLDTPTQGAVLPQPNVHVNGSLNKTRRKCIRGPRICLKKLFKFPSPIVHGGTQRGHHSSARIIEHCGRRIFASQRGRACRHSAHLTPGLPHGPAFDGALVRPLCRDTLILTCINTHIKASSTDSYTAPLRHSYGLLTA